MVLAGSKKVESTVQWEGNKKIVGTVNNVAVNVQFAPGATNPNERAAINAGSKFTLTLKGLKAGSSASTGLSTKSGNLAKATASSKGAVKVTVTIPKTAKAGAQKLRISVVDRNGKTVSLWFGVNITK